MIAAATKLLTADEFVQQYENQRFELYEGRLEELPMPGTEHGFICVKVVVAIATFVETHQLGRVMSNDTFVRTHQNPDTVRGGDVCYWSYERLPKGPVPKGVADQPPDLVFEVYSPSDRWNRIVRKACEYLEAGVRVVVLIDPKTSAVAVMRPDEFQQVFDNGDTLTIPDVLPGFSIPVKQLFS